MKRPAGTEFCCNAPKEPCEDCPMRGWDCSDGKVEMTRFTEMWMERMKVEMERALNRRPPVAEFVGRIKGGYWVKDGVRAETYDELEAKWGR